MKRQTFNALFFIRKTQLKKSGETSIMLRITIEGQLTELQLKRDVMPTQWNQAKERCTGKDATSMEINRYLQSVKLRLLDIHREMEDAGKLIHDEWEDCSLVDFNRSGVPLIEIVSEPDMRSAEEVIAYLDKLRLIIQYLGASDCKLQEGSMRADVNLSVREVGAKEFGTRTEMKNLTSLKAIA